MTELAHAPVSSIGSAEELDRTVTAALKQGLIVVGSIGRGAVFDRLAGNPYLEFEKRDQHPLVGSHIGWVGMRVVRDLPCPRDVDTLGGAFEHTPGESFVHPLHDGAFNNQEYHILRDKKTGRWSVFTTPMHGQNHVNYSLPADMFSLYPGQTVFGIDCPTVSAALHYVLLANNPMRPQDELPRKLLMDVMPPEEKALLETEPFQQLLSTRTSW